MDGMDEIYDDRAWCIMKSINVQNKFVLLSRGPRVLVIFNARCPMSKSLMHILLKKVENKLYWLSLYYIHPLHGWWTPTLESRVQYKVCHSPPICFVCYARIEYIYSQSPHMYPPRCSQPPNVHRCVFKVTGHDMENEVSKTPTTKNSMFVMAASK